jgi:hypothetical protein
LVWSGEGALKWLFSHPRIRRFTPLHRACWGGEERHTRTVRVLLDAGVLLTEPSADGAENILNTQNRGTRALLRERQDTNAEL